jgi:methionyl-tRNA formyltransferase
MRLIFMGSPDFAVPALRALAERHEVAAVYCQPPKPAGRGLAETKCAVHRAAEALGMMVRTPVRLKRDEPAQASFAALGADFAVVAAYGLILPKPMLSAPRRGCLNIHASLLPRWRGASPINAAILAGDAETGVTIMRMDEGLDTGPMLLAEATPIGPRETAASLHHRLAAIGARLILRALAEDPPAVPQPTQGATHAAKLAREDGRLDWTQDAAALDRRVRAFDPWPGTFCLLRGAVLKVLAAEPAQGSGPPGTVLRGLTIACGSGALALLRVQAAGGRAMAAEDFLRGHPVAPGSVLG